MVGAKGESVGFVSDSPPSKCKFQIFGHFAGHDAVPLALKNTAKSTINVSHTRLEE